MKLYLKLEYNRGNWESTFTFEGRDDTTPQGAKAKVLIDNLVNELRATEWQEPSVEPATIEPSVTAEAPAATEVLAAPNVIGVATVIKDTVEEAPILAPETPIAESDAPVVPPVNIEEVPVVEAPAEEVLTEAPVEEPEVQEPSFSSEPEAIAPASGSLSKSAAKKAAKAVKTAEEAAK